MENGKASKWQTLAVALVIVVVLSIAYFASNNQARQTGPLTTATSPSSVELAINGTSFSSKVRRSPTSGSYFIDTELDLFHNLKIPVHFINASVTLLNITTVEGARVVNSTTWTRVSAYVMPFPDMYRVCSEFGPFPQLPENLTIRTTLYVQNPSAGGILVISNYFTATNMPQTTMETTCAP